MKTYLTRIFTVALLTMVSMGAWAEVEVKIESFTGGEITASVGDEKNGEVEVTLTVTPDNGYTISKSDIEVYATISPNGTRADDPEISGTLELKGDDPKDLSAKRDYTVTVKSNFGVWVKTANFQSSGQKGGGTRSIDYKYVIINNKGNKAFNYTIRGGINYTSINKEQLCVHPKAKSVLATNFRFYTTEEAAVNDANGTIGTSGTDYYTEGTAISGITGVTDNTFYVRYSLKNNPAIDISGEKLYKIQARNRKGTLFYIAYQASDKTIRIKSNDENNNSFLWKIESGDPYDMYIYNLQGTADHSNGVFTVRNIVNASGESALNSIYYDDEITSGYNQSASSMNLQSFILTQGSNEGYQYNNNWKTIWESSYQIIGAYNAIENKPRDEGGSNTYALPGNMPYYVCVNGSSEKAPGSNDDQLQFYRNWRVEDPSSNNTSQIKFIEVTQTYTFHIINNSGAEAVCASTTSELNAGATITASMIPDIIKSPLANNYTFYSTAADAAAGSNALTRLPYPSTDIYVRYTTYGGDLDVNGETDYYVSTNSKYLYASSASEIGIESSITSTDNTRKWIITGNDAYQLILQNAGNSNYVTYNVSSGEAVPTLSASGSKFFLHQGTNGKYELVAVTSNDFSTTDYYTLGVANNTLKLYSKTNYPLGNDAVQTFFSDHDFCANPEISFNQSNEEVTIDCATTGATIYYTTDGSEPDPAQVGGGNPTQQYNPSSKPIVSVTTTIKAIATKSGSDDSEVASLTIVLTPTITLEGTPCTYDGTAKEPVVSSVKVGETTIDPSEYTVSYSNNTDAGNATVTITDKEGGDYYVAGSTTFTINSLSIGSGTTPANGFSIDVSMSGENYQVTVKYNETTLTEGTDYSWSGGPEVTVTGLGNYTGTVTATYVAVTPGYYALHQNGVGYLKISGADVNLGNDGTFRSGNLFDSGNCIWYLTSDGYLQNEYFYLNVANNKTPYLSVTPVTRWRTEDVTGENTYDKKHLKINDGANDLYLCNDNGSITLKTSTTAYYNACPVNVEQVSWDETPVAENLTLQSPQLVTYLRAYFKQKIKYSFHNDAGTEVKSTDGKHERRVYAKISYKEGGTGKVTDWDIDASGVLYNKKTSGDAEFTATYNILPADPVALAAHSTAATKEIKYKVQQKVFAPVADMDYLLFSIPGGDNYRYPFDDDNGITDGNPVKPNGKGGTTNESVLTDPDSNKNEQISWKITADAEGFYTFQNTSTNKYLYFDETPHASSDYGTLCVGSSPTGNSGKFRLYKAANDANYGTCYYIIPYSKIFAVYKSDGLAGGLYTALNIKDYRVETPVISLFKPNTNSTWCIYKYEAEYRVRTDFTISGNPSTSVTGNQQFQSEGWYGKYIKESPKTGDGQRGLVIRESYDTNVQYAWTVEGLSGYSTVVNGTDNTYTATGNSGKKLTLSVTSLPVSSTSGVIKLTISGGTTPNVKTSPEKTFAFTILGDGNVVWQEISSLSEITNENSAYRLTGNVSDTPEVTTFSGILDGNGYTISGLNAPLFTTLTNGTVRNVNLSGVNITSHSGSTGAIAGTANGGSRIYNVGILDGSVGSSDGYCGGLVGLLDGSARVINCFSYADITEGTYVGGIVGYNNYKTKSNDVRTMVMNCMFYGDITATGATQIAPVYGGSIIHNKRTSNSDTGLNNYCYFLYDEIQRPYVTSINTYNGALGAEERFLNRFEFFRLTLNSTRALAAFYVSADAADKDLIAKWVLDKTVADYPILKTPAYYPSIINPDAANAENIDANNEHRNEGRKLGTLTVNIQGGSGGAQFEAPAEASIATTSLTLNVTDKDYDNYNFNYKKVQLPYYSEVGTGNYYGNRVVTGWKIVKINGSSTGTGAEFTTGADVVFNADGTIQSTPYNFVDRTSTNKDLYSKSERVFNQGAYWEVPDGVSTITIEPYWAKAVYLSDANYDVTYSGTTKYGVTVTGTCPTTINGQEVYNKVSDAISALGSNSEHKVYDYAVVLVGNYHQYASSAINSGDTPITFMSADLDGDLEPDNTLFYYHSARQQVAPIRFDFLNIPGVGMVKRTHDSTNDPEPGIFRAKSWFEITNTVVIRFGQFEYADEGRSVASPTILQGGIYEQFVSAHTGNSKNTQYLLIGGNAWFKNFANGCHTNTFRKTPKVPINVTGGDYENFYLTGIYQPDGAEDAGNAECYIDGGRFSEVAGAGMQVVKGDVTWLINGADITNFYGGGINAVQPITGNITTVISNSYVDEFHGGPKFGDMTTGKSVTTTATDCHFVKFYGAGYGGTAFNRVNPGIDDSNSNDTRDWNSWVTSYYKRAYDSGNKGISTSYDYEFIMHSNGSNTVARFFVNYASLSLASTRDVKSNLNGCTIGTFFGGGRLGAVNGNIESTLTDCTVTGNAYGAGFSAEVPTVDVWPNAYMNPNPTYNRQANVFNNASVKFPTSVVYKWDNDHGLSTSTCFYDNNDEHYIYTNVSLSSLGVVSGNATLTLEGNSNVGGSVYGGGDESAVTGNTIVNLYDNTQVTVNVFGGGNKGEVGGTATVNIE